MNCIAETLATLRAKRDELSQIIAGLERMFGAELGTVTGLKTKEDIRMENGTLFSSGTKAPKAETITPSRATAEELKVESGLSKKGASSTVYRRLERGWLKKEAPGLFSRTTTFGGAASVTEQSRQMLDEIHKEEAAKLQKED